MLVKVEATKVVLDLRVYEGLVSLEISDLGGALHSHLSLLISLQFLDPLHYLLPLLLTLLF